MKILQTGKDIQEHTGAKAWHPEFVQYINTIFARGHTLAGIEWFKINQMRNQIKKQVLLILIK